MSKRFLMVFAMVLAMVVSAAAAPNGNNGNGNGNNGNTGNGQGNTAFSTEGVSVTYPKTVIVGEDIVVTVTVENKDDRGIPEITGWYNGVCVKRQDSIVKGGTFTFKIKVATTGVGVVSFDLAVWSRIDNKNWAFDFLKGIGTFDVEVLPIPVDDPPMLDGIRIEKGEVVIDRGLLGLPPSGAGLFGIWVDGNLIGNKGYKVNNNGLFIEFTVDNEEIVVEAVEGTIVIILVNGEIYSSFYYFDE